MPSIKNLFEKLPPTGRDFLFVTSTVAIGCGTGYLLYKWMKGKVKEKTELYRNTVEFRKPPELWNTAIFFPDRFPHKPNSKTSQFLWYFKEAKISIQICTFTSCFSELVKIVADKHQHGLLVQVVTECEEFANAFREQQVKVGVYPKQSEGHLMHNKFVIIDGEAVMTGSLNWVLSGLIENRENVVISTNPQHVEKYLHQFYKLLKVCEDANALK